MLKKSLQTLFLVCYFSGSCWGADKLLVDEINWLNRLTYGINSAVIHSYQALGKQQFLQAQLSPDPQDSLPEDIHELVTKSLAEEDSLKARILAFQEENKRIKSLDKDEKQEAQKELHKQVEDTILRLAQRHLLRDLYSASQLKEQMVWFWLNHFNVFKNKNGNVKLALADYEEQTIRPRALGKFRDLLLAVLRHPAMLIYLDNAKNAANKINENYARELLELHTLSVDGGYTQQDVQELARILTGVGVNCSDKTPKLKPTLKPYYQHVDCFEFNPARHDFGKKTFLGKSIEAQGFAETEQILDILVHHSATAHFISKKLALYFVSDAPSDQLIETMAKTFQNSDGDIAKTLQTLFASAEFSASLGKKASDPLHYVLATVRFMYDGQNPTNMKPIMWQLNRLGQPLYSYPTPDGYGLTAQDWLSGGQLLNRFQLAKSISRYNPRLFEEQDNGFSLAGLFGIFSDKSSKKVSLPKLTTPLFYQAIEPLLSEQTKNALNQAKNAQEWNSLLLSSPEFLYR